MTYDNQPLIDNGIVYKDIQIYPRSIKYVQNKQVCMMSETSSTEESKDLPLIHSHLVVWGQEESPSLD